MKILFILIIYLFSAQLTLAQDGPDKGDFTYDAKTGAVVPKYLGKVKLMKGSATVSTGAEERPISQGDKIYANSTITTASGVCKVEMVDSTLVTIGPNSSLNFEKFKYRTRKDRESVLKLLRGQMRTHFKVKSEKPDQLKVKVGGVAMGIRGTKILMNRKFVGDKEVNEVALIEGSGKLYDSVTDHDQHMNVGDHYVSIVDKKNNSASKGSFKLSPQEVNHLLDNETDPNSGFRPLLDPYQVSELKGSSGKTRSAAAEEDNSWRRSQNGSWRNTLNGLNQALKENND